MLVPVVSSVEHKHNAYQLFINYCLIPAGITLITTFIWTNYMCASRLVLLMCKAVCVTAVVQFSRVVSPEQLFKLTVGSLWGMLNQLPGIFQAGLENFHSARKPGTIFCSSELKNSCKLLPVYLFIFFLIWSLYFPELC